MGAGMIADVIDRHVSEWHRRPFRVGEDDCAFALRAILAETGATSRFGNVVGLYSTAAEIDDFMAEETGGGGLVALIAALARAHGWRRIAPELASDGDIAIGRGLERKQAGKAEPFLAIRRGAMFLSRARFGVACLPPSRLVVAWQVKHGGGNGDR